MRVTLWVGIISLLVGFAGCSCGDDDDDSTPSDDDIDDDADDDGDDDADDDDTWPPLPDDDADDDLSGEEVVVFEDGDDLVIGNNRASLRYHRSFGRYSVMDGEGIAVIERAESQVLSNVMAPAHIWRTSQLSLSSWSSDDYSCDLGEGRSITLVFASRADEPDLELTFVMLDAQSALLADMLLVNSTDDDLKVGSMYALLAEPPVGAMRFGEDKDLRFLGNGTLTYLEFLAPIFPGTTPAIANWNALIYNQETGRSLAAGYLTFDVAASAVYMGPRSNANPGQTLHLTSEYDFAKTVAPGESLAAETMILDFGQDTPFDALELYADRLKAWHHIQTWTERHPEIGIPVGWNSWSGSGSSGGYGTNINEAIIVDNMDFADRELRRWGMNYFQIDDGYALVGDWEPYEDRFPDHGLQNGVEWLLSRASGLGFQTGLWVEAFNARDNAQIFADHPDWFVEPWLFGLLGVDPPSLDMTNPEVQQHLAELMEKLLDWGCQWIKLDFAYRAPLSQGWYEPNTTRGEFYRQGVQIMRDALGPDVFFLNVAITGWNVGLVDSIRLTLDTMPAWDGEHPDSPVDNQGLKPMYRDAVRKYWLHNRVWVNHPDLIFFRAHEDTQIPPLTVNESLTFATSVALQGGLVKIGDRLVDLQPDWVDGYRRIMPVYGVSGRPLDMFEREFPEVLSTPAADFAEPYHVIGLLNWGTNRDLTNPYFPPTPDGDKTIAVELERAGLDGSADYHAYEYWTEEYLGTVSGELALEVPARTPRVVALRPVLDRPQFLGTNRHVMGGVKVVSSIEWNDAALTLTGVQEASVGTAYAPFEFHLAFFVPDGYAFDDIDFQLPVGISVVGDSTSLFPAEGGQVLDVYFSVEESAPPAPGDAFKNMTWVLSFSQD